MNAVTHIVFFNNTSHPEVKNDGLVYMYAMRNNIYTRINNRPPKLVAGIVVLDNAGTDSSNVRAGNTTLNTGTTTILFSRPLGLTGDDYVLLNPLVRDPEGAEPSWAASNFTRFGFDVRVYSDNITFRWAAVLNI